MLHLRGHWSRSKKISQKNDEEITCLINKLIKPYKLGKQDVALVGEVHVLAPPPQAAHRCDNTLYIYSGKKINSQVLDYK
jgi:hypothetical protein